MDKIKEILSNYSKEDRSLFHDTVDMLFSKGVANGVYQDMMVLVDIIEILAACEEIIKNN